MRWWEFSLVLELNLARLVDRVESSFSDGLKQRVEAKV